MVGKQFRIVELKGLIQESYGVNVLVDNDIIVGVLRTGRFNIIKNYKHYGSLDIKVVNLDTVQLSNSRVEVTEVIAPHKSGSVLN